MFLLIQCYFNEMSLHEKLSAFFCFCFTENKGIFVGADDIREVCPSRQCYVVGFSVHNHTMSQPPDNKQLLSTP